jgi:hypothetical protein
MSAIQPTNQPQPGPGAGTPTVTGEFAPCPNCKTSNASKVGFTWWGGVLGPKLLNVVKCMQCGSQYNGKTGGTLTTAIAIYTCVAIGIGILVAVLLSSMR